MSVMKMFVSVVKNKHYLSINYHYYTCIGLTKTNLKYIMKNWIEIEKEISIKLKKWNLN